MAILKQGLVQLYTGDGKGKTTAAFGLAWRMLGWGGRVYICQFCKPVDMATGEAHLAERLGDALKLDQLAESWDMASDFANSVATDRMREAISAKLEHIAEISRRGTYDLMILDELVFCLNRGLADAQTVYDLIARRAGHLELVLTGRGADERLIDKADLVTVMQQAKHPYQSGTICRRGIEY